LRNPQAVWAFLAALLSLGVVAAAIAGLITDVVGLTEALPPVPIALLLALGAVSLGRRARDIHQRSLGRAGHPAVIAFARGLAAIALIVAVTAALALAVFAVLTLALD
jgi:hypothetical protein